MVILVGKTQEIGEGIGVRAVGERRGRVKNYWQCRLKCGLTLMLRTFVI